MCCRGVPGVHSCCAVGCLELLNIIDLIYHERIMGQRVPPCSVLNQNNNCIPNTQLSHDRGGLPCPIEHQMFFLPWLNRFNNEEPVMHLIKTKSIWFLILVHGETSKHSCDCSKLRFCSLLYCINEVSCLLSEGWQTFWHNFGRALMWSGDFAG